MRSLALASCLLLVPGLASAQCAGGSCARPPARVFAPSHTPMVYLMPAPAPAPAPYADLSVRANSYFYENPRIRRGPVRSVGRLFFGCGR